NSTHRGEVVGQRIGLLACYHGQGIRADFDVRSPSQILSRPVDPPLDLVVLPKTLRRLQEFLPNRCHHLPLRHPQSPPVRPAGRQIGGHRPCPPRFLLSASPKPSLASPLSLRAP